MGDATVISRFRIEAPLGQGGMGEVYRAWDTVLARHVALKWIRHDRREDASTTGRFLREARTAAALRHPNIVTIYDFGSEADGSYIVMELLEGRSLRAASQDPTVPPLQKLTWLREIASALAAAHAAAIVHRDVKPSNVMVCLDGHLKVLDFGLAKKFGLMTIASASPGPTAGPASFRTESGVAVGTPLYMAPEQARGEDTDPRVDQFAWGALGYELLHCRRWTQALRDAPPPLGVPAGALEVLRRATEVEPVARYRTMNEAIDHLDRTLGMRGMPLGVEATRTQSVASARPPSLGHAEPLQSTISSTPAPAPAPAPALAHSRSAPWLWVLGIGVAALGVTGLAVGAFAWGHLHASSAAASTSTPSTSAASSSSAAPVATPPAPLTSASAAALASASATARASASPPAAPPRVRYGGALAPNVASAILAGSCQGCDVQAFVDAVRASHGLFAPCFTSTMYEPPFHADAQFTIDVTADGKFGAARQSFPKPAHPKLEACVARAMKSVPLVKRGGGAGAVEINFSAYCAQGHEKGAVRFDRCGD